MARNRRYGQKKEFHIYHVVAQHSIDVDILEHRHRRSDAITTQDPATELLELSSINKEKTKLVRNNKGKMMLVPHTWLADEAKPVVMDIEVSTKKFTSLINFSEGFEQEDDDLWGMQVARSKSRAILQRVHIQLP